MGPICMDDLVVMGVDVFSCHLQSWEASTPRSLAIAIARRVVVGFDALALLQDLHHRHLWLDVYYFLRTIVANNFVGTIEAVAVPWQKFQ
jgi:hypothetical protein